MFLGRSMFFALIMSAFVRFSAAGPAADMAAAKVKVADFKVSGNPGDLRVIEENLSTGKWRIREEVPSYQLFHPTPELLADFHRVFALGMEVFEALDARDAQLAGKYSEEDELGLQRAFPFKRLRDLVPAADFWKFQPTRLDVMDANLIPNQGAREEFLRRRERYFHAEAVKKVRRECDEIYDRWRSRLGSVIEMSPPTDRPKLIEAVMKSVKRERVRAALIPGYVISAANVQPPTPAVPPGTPEPGESQNPGAIPTEAKASDQGKPTTGGSAGMGSEEEGSSGWSNLWLIGAGVIAVLLGILALWKGRRKT